MIPGRAQLLQNREVKFAAKRSFIAVLCTPAGKELNGVEFIAPDIVQPHLKVPAVRNGMHPRFNSSEYAAMPEAMRALFNLTQAEFSEEARKENRLNYEKRCKPTYFAIIKRSYYRNRLRK